MSSWGVLKDRVMPVPPTAEESTVNIAEPVGKFDGRKARRTGRSKQFNPRVRPQFLERFTQAMQEEEERSGERITQAYFLEILLASYERGNGVEVIPFGLPEAALKGAEAISEKMGWPLSQVLEDAIAARCRDLDLAKGRSKGRREKSKLAEE